MRRFEGSNARQASRSAPPEHAKRTICVELTKWHLALVRGKAHMPQPVTFLVEVGNNRYWAILDELFAELGYRDYTGALQRFRPEHLREVEFMPSASTDVAGVLSRRALPHYRQQLPNGSH
jgi:hypothetical protein